MSKFCKCGWLETFLKQRRTVVKKKQYRVLCQHCKKMKPAGLKPSAKFCGDACRQRACRKRKAKDAGK